MSANSVKVHIKNNRWAEGSFPNTPEGEEVFTITQERFDAALAGFPALKGRMEVFIDWDEDNFASSMADTDVLLTWNLPTDGLGDIAKQLKWIHCIGAGVEHMLPMDWLPGGVALTNNKGVHADKAGEYELLGFGDLCVRSELDRLSCGGPGHSIKHVSLSFYSR